VVSRWAGKRPCIVRRCGAALRRKPAETRFGVAAEKSWGKLERSNELFRESGDDGSSDGGAATHCAPPEFSYECESRAFLLGAGGWVERYVSRRNAPYLDFLCQSRTTKIPCAKVLSQAGREGGQGSVKVAGVAYIIGHEYVTREETPHPHYLQNVGPPPPCGPPSPQGREIKNTALFQGRGGPTEDGR
jgi:hypothetical protein